MRVVVGKARHRCGSESAPRLQIGLKPPNLSYATIAGGYYRQHSLSMIVGFCVLLQICPRRTSGCLLATYTCLQINEIGLVWSAARRQHAVSSALSPTLPVVDIQSRRKAFTRSRYKKYQKSLRLSTKSQLKTRVRPPTAAWVGPSRSAIENNTTPLQNSTEPIKAALFSDRGLITHLNGEG